MKDPKGLLKKICEYFFSAAIIGFVLLLLLWFFYYFNIFSMPNFITRFFGGRDGEVDSSYYNEEHFYDFLLKNEGVNTYFTEVSLTNDNVKSVISSITPISTFYWKAQTQLFYENKSNGYQHTVWSFDGKMRVDSASTYTNTTTVINEDTTLVRNNINGRVNKIVGDTDFSFDEIINIADIALYMDSSLSEVKEARFIDADSDKYLFVSFYTEKLDKVDSFYISLDYGIVLFAYSEISNVKVFEQKTQEFLKQYSYSEDIFKIE